MTCFSGNSSIKPDNFRGVIILFSLIVSPFIYILFVKSSRFELALLKIKIVYLHVFYHYKMIFKLGYFYKNHASFT